MSIEAAAQVEHEQWAHWTRYMLANLTPENIARWQKQTSTPYVALTEREKDSDREWAHRSIAAWADDRVLYQRCTKCDGGRLIPDRATNLIERCGCREGFVPVSPEATDYDVLYAEPERCLHRTLMHVHGADICADCGAAQRWVVQVWPEVE